MDVRQLQLFIAVAEEGSIHGGARRMMVAQPAMSKALRALERQLQTQLVQRSPRGIELTTAGEALLGQAYEIVRSLERTVDIVQQAGHGQKTLTVGLISGAASASELTSDIIRGFQRLCPNVTVTVRELDFADQFTVVADGHVDVALVRTPCGDDRVSATPLFAEPLVLALRSDHKLATASTVSPEEILDETMLGMVDAPRSWTSFWHLNDLRSCAPRTGQSVRTLAELQFALMGSSDMVMPMTLTAWRMSAHHSDLRALRIEDAPQSTAAVTFHRNEDREHVLAFVEHARETSQLFLEKVPEAVSPA
ncbi:LysR family transcriptional regulator [Arthrobacter sp. I2-34]|uniref:LysR family transcriptional regulator n=1 Tax=Arthrobacter hankyongi TaxID=2904801 RepID=A0ABS9LBQ0_9MICC|nr:LysR family transcriptional regulator [Arthrobacter hankyongi]MCG2624106.1 LysR family transcriptional regulator [Arthrobacter hankyongi]